MGKDLQGVVQNEGYIYIQRESKRGRKKKNRIKTRKSLALKQW